MALCRPYPIVLLLPYRLSWIPAPLWQTRSQTHLVLGRRILFRFNQLRFNPMRQDLSVSTYTYEGEVLELEVGELLGHSCWCEAHSTQVSWHVIQLAIWKPRGLSDSTGEVGKQENERCCLYI